MTVVQAALRSVSTLLLCLASLPRLRYARSRVSASAERSETVATLRNYPQERQTADPSLMTDADGAADETAQYFSVASARSGLAGTLQSEGLTTAEVLLQGLRQSSIQELPVGSVPLHLLIVDRDAALRKPLEEVGHAMGFTVHAGTPAEMDSTLAAGFCDVVLLDLAEKAESLNFLQEVRRQYPRVPVLVTTSFSSVQVAAEALRSGATDFLTKPYSLEELTSMLHLVAEQRSFDLELRRLRHKTSTSPALKEMAAASQAMQKLLGMVTRVAVSQHPVLVLGETGTGKERLVRMLHAVGLAGKDEASTAAAAPFLHVPCHTLSGAMVESELFGYVRNEGSANREEHVGLLMRDGGGTLFLDEVDALPLDLQAKLLRALQTRSVRPPGSAMQRPVTARIVASSSRDLTTLVECGSFRKDLYFRLSVVNLRIPPLRQRKEDIPVLAATFLERHSRERNLNFSLGPDAVRALLQYEWPGNVTELEAVIARACSLSSGPILHLGDLASQLQALAHGTDRVATLHIDARAPRTTRDPEMSAAAIESIAMLERRAILATLQRLNGDKLMAAKLLGIGKTTLYRKLKEYGIEPS